MCHYGKKIILSVRCANPAHFLCMDCFFPYLVLSCPFYWQHLVGWFCNFVSTVPEAFRNYKLMSAIRIDFVICAALPSHSIDTRVNPKLQQWILQSSNLIYIGQILAVSAWSWDGSSKLERNWRRQSFLQSVRWSLTIQFTPGFAAAPATAKKPGASGTMCFTCSVTAKFLAALLGGISFQDSLGSSCTPGSLSPCPLYSWYAHF